MTVWASADLWIVRQTAYSDVNHTCSSMQPLVSNRSRLYSQLQSITLLSWYQFTLFGKQRHACVCGNDLLGCTVTVKWLETEPASGRLLVQ